MNIVREDLPNLTARLTVTVNEADYTEAVEKALKEYKRKANVPGFRPGMVPMGIINKMYRKGVTAEECYRKASNACFDYIENEKINTIGDLLPSDEQKPLDFDNATQFEFVFEFAPAPEVKIDLGKGNEITKYTIKVDDELREGYRTNFMRKYGRLADAEVITKDEAVTATLDNEQLQVQEAYVGLVSMDDEARKPFIGKKVGDTLAVNVNELYTSASQRASVLGVKEDELQDINPEFTLTITQIRKFAEPELNEEFYKIAFPDGDVTDEKGFKAWIDSRISAELLSESDYLFGLEVRKFLLGKAELSMPADYLKRWLYSINEGKFTMEEIEKDFDKFLEMMEWNIIQQHYVKQLDLSVTDDDMLEEAKAVTRAQFAQYGMGQVPDELLANYAQSILGNKEEAKRISDRILEHKVVEAVTPSLKIKEKSVPLAEFGKLVDQLR